MSVLSQVCQLQLLSMLPCTLTAPAEASADGGLLVQQYIPALKDREQVCWRPSLPERARWLGCAGQPAGMLRCTLPLPSSLTLHNCDRAQHSLQLAHCTM